MGLTSAFRPTLVGLDIGSGSVKAVALRRRRSGWSLVAAGEEAVRHPDGPNAFTIDPFAVSEALRRLFDRLRLRRVRIAAALPGRAAIVKHLTLPAMSPAALAEAMPWEAEQHVPFDMADVQLDYQVLHRGAAASGGALDVLFVAAKRDRIEDRTAMIRQAGQRIAMFDVEACALANAYEVNYPDQIDIDDLTLLLHVGRSATMACLLERGQLVFTRDMAIGGRAYSEALQRELGVDPETAEHMKSHVVDCHPVAASQLRDTSAQLVLEIRKTVDFYRASAPFEKISRVVLSGGACAAAGLGELLGAEFGAPFEVFDPYRRIKRAKGAAQDSHDADGPGRGPAYAIAVGLAMRREGDRRVNLRSARWAPVRARVRIPPEHRAAACGWLLLLATGTGVAGWGWQLDRQAAALDAQISQHEASLVRLRAAATLVDQAIARKAALSDRLDLIDRLRSAQKGAVILLSTLGRSLPDGLWLLELKQQGDVVHLDGRASSLTAVTDFVARLQDSGVFDRPVEIVSTGTELIDETSVVRFAVKAQAPGTSARNAAAVAAARNGG